MESMKTTQDLKVKFNKEIVTWKRLQMKWRWNLKKHNKLTGNSKRNPHN